MKRKLRRIMAFFAVFISFCLIMGFLVQYFLLRGDRLEYETVIIEKGSIVVETTDTGVFQPLKTVEVGSQIAGKVLKVYVGYGDCVKRGDVLAEIESERSKNEFEQSKIKLETIKNKIKEAEIAVRGTAITVKANRRHVEQNQKLVEEEIASKEDLLAANDAYESSLNLLEKQNAELKTFECQLREAELAREFARLNFENSYIRTPIDGIILEKAIEVGQTVSAGFQVQKLFTVCSPLEKLEFQAPIKEIALFDVNEGQEIKIIVGTTTGSKEFNSLIREIWKNPVKEGNIVAYLAIVEIDNQDLAIRPGMRGDFFIYTLKKKDILKISRADLSDALLYASNGQKGVEPEENKEYGVFVLTPNTQKEERKIKTGVFDIDYAEINGVNEGERIIIHANFNENKGAAKGSFLQTRYGGRK